MCMAVLVCREMAPVRMAERPLARAMKIISWEGRRGMSEDDRSNFQEDSTHLVLQVLIYTSAFFHCLQHLVHSRSTCLVGRLTCRKGRGRIKERD